MPYASKSQQRLFHHLLTKGEIAKSTVNEFDKATNFKTLPEKKIRKAPKKKVNPKKPK